MKPKIQESSKSKGKRSKRINQENGADEEPGHVEPIPFDQFLSGRSIRELEMRRINTLQQHENEFNTGEKTEYRLGKT